MDDAAIRAAIEMLVADAEVVEREATEPGALVYRPFPVELLPEPIRGYVRASAAAIGCDPVFVALAILAASGTPASVKLRQQTRPCRR
jgi:hypothetical protein